MSKRKAQYRNAIDEVTETVEHMIISGGDVTIKHSTDKHDHHIIVVTCKKTFYMGEEQE